MEALVFGVAVAMLVLVMAIVAYRSGWRWRRGFTELLSAEFFLYNRPNGGRVVLRRAIWATIVVYAPTITLLELLAPNREWSFSHDALFAVLRETIPWFGAIFGAMYVALYTRFSAQWTYLAEFYNQIMETRCQNPVSDGDGDEAYSEWQAAFVEDADDLHLVTKPMFALAVDEMLSRHEVADAFVATAAGGYARLRNIKARIRLARVLYVRNQPASWAEANKRYRARKESGQEPAPNAGPPVAPSTGGASTSEP